MYSKIQSVRYTKTKKKEIVKKKLGMALKQEIFVWKKISQNLGWAPHFLLKDRKKSPNRVIACFEAIQNHIKNQKIYFIYSKAIGKQIVDAL